MEEKHKTSSDIHERRLSALESINASFASMKEEAEKEHKKLEPRRREAQPSGTMDKINASFQEALSQEKEKKKNGGDVEFIWTLAAGILVTVLIVAVVIFLVMLYRGSVQDSRDRENTPAVQISDSEEPSAEESVSTNAGEETGTESSGTETIGTETADRRETEDMERAIPEGYESILNEKEIEEWKNRETDNSRLFIQMNQKLNINDEGKAYLRLINPPYSAFNIQVKIYAQDNPEEVLYQSEVLEPGTILEYADFDSIPSPGQYEGGVEYTVYDKDGSIIGTHEVAVEITAQEQQEAAGQ